MISNDLWMPCRTYNSCSRHEHKSKRRFAKNLLLCCFHKRAPILNLVLLQTFLVSPRPREGADSHGRHKHKPPEKCCCCGTGAYLDHEVTVQFVHTWLAELKQCSSQNIFRARLGLHFVLLQNFLKILETEPNNVQARHNLCVAYVEQGYLLKAEKCLADVSELAPHKNYIRQHLQIVRSRIQQAKEVSFTEVIQLHW